MIFVPTGKAFIVNCGARKGALFCKLSTIVYFFI